MHGQQHIYKKKKPVSFLTTKLQTLFGNEELDGSCLQQCGCCAAGYRQQCPPVTEIAKCVVSLLFCLADCCQSPYSFEILLVPYYISCFFIFCYKTQRKAITEAEYGLDQQKNNSDSFRTESKLWKKNDTWKLYSGKRSIFVMKQVKCAEQRKVKKCRAEHAFWGCDACGYNTYVCNSIP